MKNAFYTETAANPLSQIRADGVTYAYVHNTVIDGQAAISLRNCGNRYAVQYGLAHSAGMTYEEAAKEYGECIMHALMCAGRLV